MKKIIILLIVIALSVATVFASDIKTDKYEVLNQIGILNGNENGYELEKEITRSEGIAFIIRFLNLENNNSKVYDQATFSDVKGNEWFVSDLQICLEYKIVSGYSDGTFKPNDKLNQQEFLKMLISALEYNSSDFTWESVMDFSKELGLVESNKINEKFKKQDALDGIYIALGLDTKVSGKPALERVITDKSLESKNYYRGLIVSKKDEQSEVKAAVIDEKQEIESATKPVNLVAIKVDSIAEANFNGEVKIKFNTTVDESSALVLSNYSSSGLEFVDATLSDDKKAVVLKIVEMRSNKIYRIEVSGVKAAEGDSMVKKGQVKFGGYDYSEPSNVRLEIVSRAMMNFDGTIDITFSHELDETAALAIGNYENGAHYKKSDDMTVKKVELSSDKKTVKIYLGSIHEGRVSQIRMLNLKPVDNTVDVEEIYYVDFSAIEPK